MMKEMHFLSLPLSINAMPYQDSKMSARSFFEAAGSDILRHARTTSSKKNFQKLITTLLIKMQK